MSLADLAKGYSRPSVVLDKRDVERMSRVAEAQRVFLQEHARRWLVDRQHDTILFQYGSDLTPVMTRDRHTHSVDELSIVRSGKASQEFLIQRLFMRDLQGSTVVRIERPLPMQ